MLGHTVVTIEDVRAAESDHAAEECVNARAALAVADMTAAKAIVLAQRGEGDLARVWASLARGAANVGLGHAGRAAKVAPGSRAARDARQHADLAAAHAFSAERATEQD